MSSEVTYPLTGEQKNQLHELVESPVAGAPLADLKGNPHLRVFAIHFDGTQNDRLNVPGGYQATLVSDSFEKLRQAEDPRLVSHYINGVATRTNGLRRMLEATTGFGCEDRAEKAHRTLVEQAKAWLKEDPKAQIHVHVVGFSRGAATALHFMNLVDKRGALNIDEPQSDATLAPGKVLTSAVLYDTVATGQRTVLDLAVPPTAMSVLHLVAGGEERLFFPVQAIADTSRSEACAFVINDMNTGRPYTDPKFYQRINEITLPGARHSDVGGAYIGGNLREVSAYMAESFQASMGLPVEPKKPTFKEIEEARFHDSLFISISEDQEQRQKATDRNTVGRPPSNAKGVYMLDVQIQGLEQEGNAAKAAKAAKPVAEQSFFEFGNYERLGLIKPMEMRVVPFDPEVHRRLDGNPFQALGIELEGDAAGLYAINTDGRVTVGGNILPGLPTADVIANQLHRKQESGAEHEISMRVAISRFAGTCEISRDCAAPLPSCPKPAEDPWPEAVREQIRWLNANPRLSMQQAAETLNKALFAAGEIFQKQCPPGAVVCVQSQRAIDRSELGITKNRNVFDLQYEVDGELVSTLSPQGVMTSEIRELRERAHVISESLEALGGMLRERGFAPRMKNRHFVYPGQTEPSIDLACVERIAVANEPGHSSPQAQDALSLVRHEESLRRGAGKLSMTTGQTDAEAGNEGAQLYEDVRTKLRGKNSRKSQATETVHMDRLFGRYLFGTLSPQAEQEVMQAKTSAMRAPR